MYHPDKLLLKLYVHFPQVIKQPDEASPLFLTTINQFLTKSNSARANRKWREFVMSYFDFYFNTDGDKSLRSYSLPLDLTIFNQRHWATTDEDLEYIGDKLEKIHHYPVVNKKMIKNLKRASDIMLKAGMLGSNADGLFKPK